MIALSHPEICIKVCNFAELPNLFLEVLLKQTNECLHFFFFLPIWTSSFEKAVFSSLAHFFIGSLILGEVRFLSSLYILVLEPLSDA
jgi:hypothetical protein